MKIKNIHLQWARFRRLFTRFTWGGEWAAPLPAKVRRNLTLYFYNGLFAASGDKIILTYTSIYLLSLGATRQQIGLLSSLSNLTAALLLLPAALLVERSGEPKRITLTTISGSRLSLLLMALLPFFIKDTHSLIWIVLLLALLRETFANMAYPGWMTLTGDIIPREGRGRYFGTRNFIMGLTGIITVFIVGKIITEIGEPLGYQLALVVAVILGIISMAFLARVEDPKKGERTFAQAEIGLKALLTSLKGQRQFIYFCVFTAVWSFSLYIVVPFINVYLVDTLQFSAAMIGVGAVASTITSLLIQRRIGILSEKIGNWKLAIVFLLLIPVVPLLWGLWVQQYWQAVVIKALSGLLWGSYNLVIFNILLLLTPDQHRARFSAFYQIVVTLGIAGGAAVGALLIPYVDFKGVALTSTAGRWLACAFFILIVHKSQPESPKEERQH